jgi:UDP-N-acetylmuramyl tripeptide synthase
MPTPPLTLPLPAASRHEQWTARDRAAVLVGRAVGRTSRAFGRGSGTHLPGRVMLGVAPQLGAHLATDRVVVLVSATNGKSSITTMISAALQAAGHRVATNRTGANMMPGLVTALADDPEATIAVLETDEAVVPRALRELRPALVVLGELSRDQLDRHHEVLRVANLWRTAFVDSRARFVAPINDPNVVWSLANEPPPAVTWVDLQHHASLDSAVCPQCKSVLARVGDTWECHCGFRPPVATVVQRDDDLMIDGATHRAPLSLPGGWQLANRALAVAATSALGLPVDAALAAIADVTIVGVRPRQLRFPDGLTAPALLVKNPAGWNALVEHLLTRTDEPTLLFVQHDNASDGRDPSWLWDVDFERLAGRPVVTSGIRALDVAVRLHTAGMRVIAAEPDPIVAATRVPAHGQDGARDAFVAASYSAYHELLRRLEPA